jgi:hypothetical protein
VRDIRVALILVVLASPATAADENYLCIADMATGFKLDQPSKKWQIARFDVSKHRYIIRRTEKGLAWNEFGSSLAAIPCSEFNDWGSTVCSDGIETMTFNKVNLRYQRVYASGWIDGDLPVPAQAKDPWGCAIGDARECRAGPPDTPLIEIGTCSAI